MYVAGDDNYGKVEAKYYDDFDYKVSAKCNEDGLFVNVQRNELDINALRSEYRGLFELDDMKRFPYRLEDFEQESYQMHLELNELFGMRDSKLLEEYASKLGAFRFDFYFVKSSKSDISSENSDAKYPYRQFSPTHRRQWLKKNIGVKILLDKENDETHYLHFVASFL